MDFVIGIIVLIAACLLFYIFWLKRIKPKTLSRYYIQTPDGGIIDTPGFAGRDPQDIEEFVRWFFGQLIESNADRYGWIDIDAIVQRLDYCRDERSNWDLFTDWIADVVFTGNITPEVSQKKPISSRSGD